MATNELAKLAPAVEQPAAVDATAGAAVDAAVTAMWSQRRAGRHHERANCQGCSRHEGNKKP